MVGIRGVFVVAALAAVVAGCGDPPAEVADPTDLFGRGVWHLESASIDEVPLDFVEEGPLTIAAAEGGVEGHGGCNAYVARVVVDGESIRFDDIGTSLYECVPESVMVVEDTFLAAMADVTSIEMVPGEQLTLTGPTVSLVFAPDA